MVREEYDVVGIGENSMDELYRLPGYPRPDSDTAKMRISSRMASPGGQVATTLCTCAALGLRTRYVGAFGSDDNGARVRNALRGRGVDVSRAVIREAPNRHAIILIAEPKGERVVLWERDARLALDVSDVDPSMIAGARLLHVDDVDEDVAIRTAETARAAGLMVTADIDRVTGLTGALVAATTIPIFSEHALLAFTGGSDHARALRSVREHHDGMLCVTRGARGAMLLEGDRLHDVPAQAIDAVDTTGAGDVFRGAFIYALLRGDAPRQILRFANAAAALSCTRLGAIPSVPALPDVEALMGKGV
jgi:sulfofructose kinase